LSKQEKDGERKREREREREKEKKKGKESLCCEKLTQIKIDNSFFNLYE
jgi:hypothetical protein